MEQLSADSEELTADYVGEPTDAQIFAVIWPLMRIAVAPHLAINYTGPLLPEWQELARTRLSEIGIDYKKFSVDEWWRVLKS